MEKELDIVVEADGTIRFIHDDDVAELFAGEATRTKRASNVEPHPAKGGWLVDLRPVGGPVLGVYAEVNVHDNVDLASTDAVAFLDGFVTRRAALAAEVAWLKRERGL